jgi:CRP-like cAMP-binding protein
MPTTEALLRGHPFLAGLDESYLPLLAACASPTEFAGGSLLFREGDPADQFFLVHDGKLALELTMPGRSPFIVQTLGPGDVAGFSWLLDPHVWEFSGRTLEPVRATVLDGRSLRAECEEDSWLGFDLMRRFARLATGRLQATRLRLLDVYGNPREIAG